MIVPEMKSSRRVWLGILLVTVILAMIGYLLIVGKDAFTKTTKIAYPDGCTEVYKNDNLTTPECTNGRIIAQQQHAMIIQQQGYNFTPIAVGNTS